MVPSILLSSRQPREVGESERQQLDQGHPGSFVTEWGFGPESPRSTSNSQTPTSPWLVAYTTAVAIGFLFQPFEVENV